MISASASPPVVLRPQFATISLVGSGLVTVAVFLSGFVIAEPAPYELFMACLIGLWALFGLKISRYVAPLLSLLVLFMVGGMLSLTVMADLATGPMYMAVSGFLALSAVFFAAIIEDRHQRLRLIFNAWVAAAVITALLGVLGYFGAIPGGANFTLYDRAKERSRTRTFSAHSSPRRRFISSTASLPSRSAGLRRRSSDSSSWRSAFSSRSRERPGHSISFASSPLSSSCC